MKHLDEILGFPGLMANVGHGIIIGVFYSKSSLLINKALWVTIYIINHHYVGTCFHKS